MRDAILFGLYDLTSRHPTCVARSLCQTKLVLNFNLFIWFNLNFKKIKKLKFYNLKLKYVKYIFKKLNFMILNMSKKFKLKKTILNEWKKKIR